MFSLYNDESKRFRFTVDRRNYFAEVTQFIYVQQRQFINHSQNLISLLISRQLVSSFAPIIDLFLIMSLNIPHLITYTDIGFDIKTSHFRMGS